MSLPVDMTRSFIDAVRAVDTVGGLQSLMSEVATVMGCRYYALVHHDRLPDHYDPRLIRYPPAVIDYLSGRQACRRDPVLRGCIFADSAFLWSELGSIITLDGKDRAAFAFGASEGLNEGITVPCSRLGESLGSCTFAGIRRAEDAHRLLGAVQMIGVFAFQAARRVLGYPQRLVMPPARLHPRPRDCVVLAGRGYSNKEIARCLHLAPRTVDGYLTEARRLFDAHDRTELVVSAVLAGEVGLHELRRDRSGFPPPRARKPGQE